MILQPVARFRKTGKLQIAAVAWWTIIWRKLLYHIEPLCWDWNCRAVLLLTFCFGLAPREWFMLIIGPIMLSSFGCDQLSWSNDCCRNLETPLLLHRVNRVYHVIMVLSSEHAWFFKKRVIFGTCREVLILSIHEKQLLLCRVTSAFDQTAYQLWKAREDKISHSRKTHELLNFINSTVRNLGPGFLPLRI